jgi:hypothetical protein
MAGENGAGNLVGVHVPVGARVQLRRALTRQYRVNTNDTFDLAEGEVFEVTRVYIENLQVRTVGTKTVRVSYHQAQRQVSFSIPREFFRFEDPNYVPPPPPRKLGVMPDPEDVKLPDGIPLINIDHPGIQWLFDDLGAYADQQGYCSQYDALCVKLGIPGRPRDFDVTRVINGVSFRTTVKARSQREANEAVDAALGLKGPDNSDSVTTPAEDEIPIPA